jgi:prepilin-type N-terminal cleavage/methylation domain-containing protein
MSQRKPQRGFSLLEVLLALVLVGFSMTALVVAFVASGQFGVLARRQATALMIARSQVATMIHAPYTDVRLANPNANNDATFGDPNALFAKSTLPTGNDAPDSTLANVVVGNETYEEYVNVATDPVGAAAGSESGLFFAVIVRYKVGGKYMRAVALGYHYNPAAVFFPNPPPVALPL